MRHENVAGVHVGVKETVAEDLREENFDARARQTVQVNARRA